MTAPELIRIAVPAPLFGDFDYLPPADVDPQTLTVGARVRIPFGRARHVGLILETQVRESVVPQEKLRPITEVLDAEPLLAAEDLAFLRWVADYYHHPLGEALLHALPTALRKGKPLLPVERRGWRVTAAGRDARPEALTRAPKQRRLLEQLQGCPDGLELTALEQEWGPCREPLKALHKRCWIEPCVPPAIPSERTLQGAPALNPAQQQAVDALRGALGGFAPFLLDGVTGSGKTEVYLQAIETALAQGRQVLVLVPEIGLTPQLQRRFRRRIREPLAILHSGLADGERLRAWQQVRSGEARLLLGTRSALFTPTPDLGLIIVDEEHDLSFKQQEGLRYSARDLAVALAQRRGCPVVLGSATPSLESLHNARQGRYRHLILPERAGGAQSPPITLLDMRALHLAEGLAPGLLQRTRATLEAGEQVLLFLNRRGYAPLLACHDCGWVADCEHCDARMTLHHASRVLWCHHCGARRPLPTRCPRCNSGSLRALGQGTERLENALRVALPETPIVRIDRDSTRRKGELERKLQAIRAGHYPLLIGTQMLAKGHHFPDVTLVGILNADNGLFGADYRSMERLAQLVIQVAGRAGRAEKPGRVVIQTYHPDHPLLRLLIERGYTAFADEALRERQEAQLPPFAYQALLRVEARDPETMQTFMEQAAELAHRQSGQGAVEVLGPVPAPMEKRLGRFHGHLLLQSASRSTLQALLRPWVRALPAGKSGKLRWSLDVDPQELF